jgi:hypothetical protein
MKKDGQKEGKRVKPSAGSGSIKDYSSGYEGKYRDLFYPS